VTFFDTAEAYGPYKSEQQQKAEFAEQVTKAIMSGLNCAEQAASVSIEDIEPNGWVEQVYKPDIMGKPDHKKPGYNPL
jgi:4-oxalocrotonate tautomerase